MAGGLQPSMTRRRQLNPRTGSLTGIGRALLAMLAPLALQALTGRRAAGARSMWLRVSVLGGQCLRTASHSERQKRPRDRQAPEANHDPKAMWEHKWVGQATLRWKVPDDSYSLYHPRPWRCKPGVA
jgi:hypothetical protein